MGERGTEPVVAIQKQTEGYAELIVDLNSRGNGLERIACLLGLDLKYVANVFHSHLGQQQVARDRAIREELEQERQHRLEVEAQKALDKIIALASGSDSGPMDLKTAERIPNKTLDDV